MCFGNESRDKLARAYAELAIISNHLIGPCIVDFESHWPQGPGEPNWW